ncbi:MAG TPA: hypothetical protein VNA17_06195 [Pyrinomonadaceae bacterium]|nr:hypothetical protein [Pyrinomonadaceae bacterium]
MARYTEAAKARLTISMEALRRFGRAGQIIADALLKQTPPEEPGFDREALFAEIERRIGRKKK